MANPCPAPSRRSRTALLAAGLCGLCMAAWSAPEESTDVPGDPVMRLLLEKRLLEPATAAASPESQENGFVQQVRDKASDMVISAMNFLGVPYRRGGNSAEDGFDCSGFTRHVFEMSLGLVLPRRVDEQATAPGLAVVKRDELKPGDLVFFNTLKRTFSHVGIYVGEGKFIHSPRTGAQVRVEDMRFAYWSKRFTGARRAEPLRSAAAAAVVQPSAPPTSTRAEVGADTYTSRH